MSPLPIPGQPMTTPAPPSRLRAVVFLAAFIWVPVFFELAYIAPRYGKMFREADLPLPVLTNLVLAVSTFLVSNLTLAVGLTIGLMVLSGVLAYRVHRSSRTRLRKYLLLALIYGVPCLLFMTALVGVEVPHRKLLAGLK